MKHSIHVNQKQAVELGITNINQAHILDLLTGASTWATPEIVDGQVYYWVSRQRISAELPLLNLKADTIYRHLKSLDEIGLIEYIKKGKKDCMRLTPKGRSYYVGNKSELPMSEINPNNDENSDLDPNHYVGNESENYSDLNPTDPTTSNISLKDDQSSKTREKKFIKPTVDEISDYCHSRKNQINPQQFFDYYESIGWMVGRAAMKDWQAAVRTWEQREGKANETHQQGNQLRGAAAQSAAFHEDLKRFARGVDSQTVQQNAGDLHPPVDKRISNY